MTNNVRHSILFYIKKQGEHIIKFEKWFNDLRKEKFPELWNDFLSGVDCTIYDYDQMATFLKEGGEEYILFLEDLVEEMYNDLMKKNKKNHEN